MTHFAARVAGVACAVLLTAGTAGAARAEAPSCYGTSSVGFVCDPELEAGLPVGLEPWRTPAPCDSDICKQLVVDAYAPGRGEPFRLCVTWTDRDWHQRSVCVDPVPA